jgi:DNA-binding transcriptional regulator GbsR (MarR family)|tara:strand:+ start:686 stop:904 length:219 start_codon:yes stop_codon:yes gene_type:complete
LSKINRVIEDIKKILRDDTRGLTIQELSELTKVSRITAAMALAKLEGASIIDVRVIGNCKLHYLKKELLKDE